MADRVVVIGSNSFSGATLTALLLERGYQVMGMARPPEPPHCLLPYRWGNSDGFRFVAADINTDLDEMMAAINDWRPRYIANYAAQGMVAQSWADPGLWFQTNTLAMVRLHDRLRQCDFLQKYLQASTPEVYGATRGPVVETANYNPSTPYAASKAACDLSLLSFLTGYKFPVVFTRSSNVCGPGQQLYRIIPKTIISILCRKRLKLEGGGVARRSFIHMRDVAEGQLAALEKGAAGDIFHLGTDEIVSIRQLVEAICAAMGERFEDHVEVVAGRRGEDNVYELDCSKAREQLGWRPQRNLATVIAETIDWIKRDWNTIQHLPVDYLHRP